MSRHSPSLLALVQSYFQNHLRSVRGASDHTVRAYRDTLRLLFLFMTTHLGRSVDNLHLDDIRYEVVLAFLNNLEKERGNAAATRNCRLAAIRSFVAHLIRHDLTRAVRPPSYLEPQEVRVLLMQPQPDTAAGARDLALLLFLYNTGARVSEALSVRVEDLNLFRPLQVRLHGKGGKERICPLWAETARVLRALIRCNSSGVAEIFRNARGGPLTRDGVAYILTKYLRCAVKDIPALRHRRVTPHMLRHSCAVALLQAGVDLSVIRDYLGHVSIATTGRYLTSNLEMKRRVLETFWRRAGLTRTPDRPWRPSQNTLSYLNSLSSSLSRDRSGN
jgi:site-specific recombinase XerD